MSDMATFVAVASVMLAGSYAAMTSSIWSSVRFWKTMILIYKAWICFTRSDSNTGFQDVFIYKNATRSVVPRYVAKYTNEPYGSSSTAASVRLNRVKMNRDPSSLLKPVQNKNTLMTEASTEQTPLTLQNNCQKICMSNVIKLLYLKYWPREKPLGKNLAMGY